MSFWKTMLMVGKERDSQPKILWQVNCEKFRSQWSKVSVVEE